MYVYSVAILFMYGYMYILKHGININIVILSAYLKIFRLLVTGLITIVKKTGYENTTEICRNLYIIS